MLIRNEVLSAEKLTKLREFVNDSPTPTRYLSIDPGKSNGICGYDERASLLFMLTIRSQDMVKFLHVFEKVLVCVIEDYKLYPGKTAAQTYSDMETSRVIGRVETWAELKGIELFKQMATIKDTAYKWLGQKPPSKKDLANHEKDAHAHFIYWGVRKGLIPAHRLVKDDARVINRPQ